MARKSSKGGGTAVKERPEAERGDRPAGIWEGVIADTPPASSESGLQVSAADLGRIIGALGEVTQVLSATSAQLAQLADGGTFTAPAALQVNSFGDDPFSQPVPTANPAVAASFAVTINAPDNPRLRTAIVEPPPASAALHAPGTSGFRYWGAAEALARGVSFWSALLPAGTTWSTSNPMRITLITPGQQLNANYSRPNGLRFYRYANGAVDIHSCESPDVVAHELGHAVLDALKPQLFNAASIEAAAFHEAFGDISAMLCALQLQPMRNRVLAETGGRLNLNSRLSRVAEQLGWGIRQLSPTAVDRDCLRNAANRFFYRPPGALPPSAPANLLSSAPHSFSRVFSGAMLDVLARMLLRAGGPGEAALLGVSRDLGQLLVDAVHAAPIGTAYFSQVASAMVRAERVRFGGRYRNALTSAFVERGLLSISSSMTLADAPVGRMVPVPMPEGVENVVGNAAVLTLEGEGADDAFRRGPGDTPELPVQAVAFGGVSIAVHAPRRSQSEAAPAMVGVAADTATDDTSLAKLFVEGLIQRGEVALGPAQLGIADLEATNPDKVTHSVVPEDGYMVLKRNVFNCGCCAGVLGCE